MKVILAGATGYVGEGFLLAMYKQGEISQRMI